MDLIRKDPYRLLFPIALFNLIVGLVIWFPYFYNGGAAPIIEHMQLLMRGTMYGFIIGFLLTMLPRVWGTDFVSKKTVLSLGIGFSLLPLCIALKQAAAFEAILLAILCIFSFQVLVVLFPRGRTTRMTFAIASVTVVCLLANIGYGLMHVGVIMPSWLGSWLMALTMKGTVLLFIFALAPFLISKFSGRGPCCSLQSGKDKLALVPIPVVGIFAASYLLAGDWTAYGIAIRTVLLLISFSEALSMWKWPAKDAWFIKGIWLSLWCIVIGQALPAILPAHVIVWNHIVYIPGFLQLCLMVGARVVCGHAQQLERIEKDRFGILTILILLLISVLSRVAVDWAPATRDLHLVLAAVFALAALALWFYRYGGLLFADKKPTLAS